MSGNFEPLVESLKTRISSYCPGKVMILIMIVQGVGGGQSKVDDG